jgi:hypothetical protein
MSCRCRAGALAFTAYEQASDTSGCIVCLLRQVPCFLLMFNCKGHISRALRVAAADDMTLSDMLGFFAGIDQC